MPISERMKKRREETLLLKLGREQFNYMQTLQASTIMVDRNQREKLIFQLGEITRLYMEIKEERAKWNTPAVASTK